MKKYFNLFIILNLLYSKLLGKDVSASFDADMLFVYLRMFFMVDAIAYERIVDILNKNHECFIKLFDLLAKIDMDMSICYYRKSLETYCIPEFTHDNNSVFENIYHPLIDEPVKNTVNINDNILLTGSNASGKSTFVKSIAINIILAQSINTALCSKYKCPYSKVISSMAVSDNIIEGDSYFMAEIKSLKRLEDSLNNDIHVFVFIDEILKGTNTIERIAASSSILKYASENTSATILVATHDIELTEILNKYYNNYHFSETVNDDGVFFDYKLKEGPSTTRNAIKLLKTVDFHEEFDMNFVKQYYKARKENETINESIDELTWNDLDMDSVFKRINYTRTTLGEVYLYRKLIQVYKNNNTSDKEELINILTNNKDLRNEIASKLIKVSKLHNEKIFQFIYNPKFAV